MNKILSIVTFLTLLALPCASTAKSSDSVLEIVNLDAKYISGEGGSTKIYVNSSSDWTLKSDCDWLTLTTTSGTASKKKATEVEIVAEFNFYDTRVATLTLSNASSDESTEYKVCQGKFVRPVTKYQVGDPEVRFDESKFDADYKYYDKMQIWRQAGVEDGVPHLEDQLAQVTKVFEAGSPASQIRDYLEQHKGEKIVVLLKNGDYLLDVPIRIYSNATLIGESRDGVKITVDGNITGSTYISMVDAQRAGLRNVWINGSWLNEDGENRPKYNWEVEVVGREKNRTIDMSAKSNCFLDNVKLTNNPSHPIWLRGDNHTVRNVEINGAFNKGGGCQGYFFIASNNALITNCRITRIRHISFQGKDSHQNVFYDNDLDQEVSFHVDDGGDNLIERNRIYLPAQMPEAYNAIMGPWSSQHRVGGLNFIYENRCKEDNPGRNGKTPWSDERLYIGPHVVSVGTNNPTRYTNFEPSSDAPKEGTLYPVVLD